MWSDDGTGLELVLESTNTANDGKREETRIRYDFRENRAKVVPVPAVP